MALRAPTAVVGLAGGLCWISAFVLDVIGSVGVEAALTWVGTPLLLVAALAAGASVVSRSTTWLRVVVAVCFAVLAASVVQVLRDAADPVAANALVGLVVAVVSGWVFAGAEPRVATPAPRHSRGSHAR